MRLRSWRGSTPLSPTTRRPFPWARVLLLLAVVALLAYLFIPNYFYVRADGLVQGDLVPVSPLYRARIDQLLVHCDDHVTKGQTVAVVSNFLVQTDFQRQYLESQQELALSKVSLDERVSAAKTNAAALKDKFDAATFDAQRTHDAYKSYDQAYKQGAIPQVEWQAKYTEWQTAEANARAARGDWQRAEQDISRITAAENARIASSQQLSDSAQAMANRVSSESLTAPVSGYVVNCVSRPQNVVEPSQPIYNIFEPNRAYVLAYFPPDSLNNVHLNQTVDVSIAGLPHAVPGRVVSIYPDLTKLPTQLTRFFWQHVQWNEYRPVRIALDRLSATDRQNLYYNAQVHVSIKVRDTAHPLALGPNH